MRDLKEAVVKIATQARCEPLAGREEGPRYRILPKADILSSYPAVKIARFGVGKPFQRKNIGSYAINMIKELFITDNRTGCRFITIDAYNTPPVLNFYKKNEFQFLSGKDKHRRTRSMFFDLKRLTL